MSDQSTPQGGAAKAWSGRFSEPVSDLVKRYPKAQVRDYDGNPDRLTEMDALIAYLQMLGTLVDVNGAKAQEELAKERGR